MSINHREINPLTNDELKALDIIRNHRALIQTISDESYINGIGVRDYSAIDDFLDQLVDPTMYRPSRSAELFSQAGQPRPETLKKMNLKTGETFDYHPGQCRFTKHKDVEFTHTAKTPTTLLPPQPEFMHVFPYSQDNIGFMWDIDACDLKDERYVWEEDAGSDACQWLSPNPDNYYKLPPLSSIAALRAINNRAIKENKTIFWNEILAGLPKGRLDAIFAPKDTREFRLRAWDAMLRAKEKLKIKNDIPVFIIQAIHNEGDQSVFRVYTAIERENDLRSGEENTLKNKTLLPLFKSSATLFHEAKRQNTQAQVDEKSKMISKLNQNIHALNSEIISYLPYPNKDRKRIKLLALNTIRSALLKQKDVIKCIQWLEAEYPETLDGRYSHRVNDLIQEIKSWTLNSTPTISKHT